MLRGGVGSRGGAAAKPRRPHLRQRLPPPAPLPQGRATVAGAESNDASVLEDPVVSSLEETSFTFEFKRGCKRAKKAVPASEAHRGKENWREGFSNKPNAVPANAPAAKEAPWEVEFTHCAPSIVARLMGLDTVPKPKKVLDRCQSDIQSSMRRKLSVSVQEVVRASCEDGPGRSSADELPELKDVFEVTEMESMAMHTALPAGDERPRPRSCEDDVKFVRQKFLDAKRLSTDEGHRNSKEFGEALEILYSKKDVFLQILQENSTSLSGFPGHTLGHSGLRRSPLARNAAVAQDNHCSSELESEDPRPSIHFKGTSAVALEHLASKGSKSKSSGRRSQIVVLKPDIRRKSLTSDLPSQETSQFGQWTGAQSLKLPWRSMYTQDGMHSMAHSYFQVLEPELHTPEQKVIRQTPKRGSRRRPSKEECYLAGDREKEKVRFTSHDEIMSTSSSAHSAGSSVSRKARKHLSERWQMACRSDAEVTNPTDTGTLGEMLQLSDKDATNETTHNFLSDTKVTVDDVPAVPLTASPLGISSKDGWKTGIYREDDSRGGLSKKFPRSKSLPASSTTIGAKLPGRRRSAPSSNLPILKDILNTPTDEAGNGHVRKRSSIRRAKQKNGTATIHGKENMLPEKDIYVASEKVRHSVCISDLVRTRNLYNERPGDVIGAGDHQTIDSAYLHSDVQNFNGQIGSTDQKLPTPLPLPERKYIKIHNPENIALKDGRDEQPENDISEVDHEAIQSELSSESCHCSSPTVSLQRYSGEESAYSGIFKSINDGIQGLRVQLKMLKLDGQVDIHGDDSDRFSSDECNDMSISNYQVQEEQFPIFKDEEDRDYSYVKDMLGGVCDFPVFPEELQVSSNVFLWLESKYSKLLLWSKSDRKLLFDLVNSTLADITAPGSTLHSKIMMNCWPEIDQRKLAKSVWQMVLVRRSSYQLFNLDSVQPLPLDPHSEIEVFGEEVFEMLHDDVLEEFVAELISQGGAFLCQMKL